MSAGQHSSVSPVRHAHYTLCTFLVRVVVSLHAEELMQDEVAALDQQQLLQQFGLPDSAILAEAEVTYVGLGTFAAVRDDFDHYRDQTCVFKSQ